LVDQDVFLGREQPGQRAGSELIPSLPEQIGRGAAHREVDLQFGVPMGADAPVSSDVAHYPPIQTGRQLEVFEHRK